MIFDAQRFFPIKPEQLSRARPHITGLLEEFERKTSLVAPEEVFRQAQERECVIWAYHDGKEFRGLAVVRIHANAVGKVCSLWVCIGHGCGEILADAHDVLERWARDNGCYELEIVGREGWLKTLPGYRKRAIVMAKRLVEVH